MVLGKNNSNPQSKSIHPLAYTSSGPKTSRGFLHITYCVPRAGQVKCWMSNLLLNPDCESWNWMSAHLKHPGSALERQIKIMHLCPLKLRRLNCLSWHWHYGSVLLLTWHCIASVWPHQYNLHFLYPIPLYIESQDIEGWESKVVSEISKPQFDQMFTKSEVS